jgi:hypothetical protein
MKLIDAIYRVDQSSSNSQSVDEERLAEALHLFYADLPTDCAERLNSYYLMKWYDTDSWVGYRVIFFDGVPVGIAQQAGRKGDTHYDFIDTHSAQVVRNYLVSAHKSKFPIIDHDEELNDFYCLEYGESILVKQGFYKGKPVTLVKKSNGHYSDRDNWSFIDVKDEEGNVTTIKAAEFMIPLSLQAPVTE